MRLDKYGALALIVVGVVVNNIVYLQDLWFGQAAITLAWRAYLAIGVCLILIAAGLVLGARAIDRKNANPGE